MSDVTEPRARRPRSAVAVGAICFALGSIMVVRADTVQDTSGRTAQVSDQHELSTADAGARARLDAVLARLSALEVAVSGSVAVSNFPANQAVNVPGGVAVTNFPATQAVTGGVAVTNFPANQAVNVPGGVAVTNFPATQAVTGGVAVTNFPATQAVSGGVTVTNLPAIQPVAGTVSVASTAASPVHITGAVSVGDVDRPAFNAQLRWQDPQTDVACKPFTVPAGSRLITETISVTGEGSLVPEFKIEYLDHGQSVLHTLAIAPVSIGTGADGTSWYSGQGMHSVKLRIDPGEHHLCFFGAVLGGQDLGQAMISGYLVPAT